MDIKLGVRWPVLEIDILFQDNCIEVAERGSGAIGLFLCVAIPLHHTIGALQFKNQTEQEPQRESLRSHQKPWSDSQYDSRLCYQLGTFCLMEYGFIYEPLYDEWAAD
jgi:hypothetical protein